MISTKNLASNHQEDKFQFYKLLLKLGPTFNFGFYSFYSALKLQHNTRDSMSYEKKSMGFRTPLTRSILLDIERQYTEKKAREQKESQLLEEIKQEHGGEYPEYLREYLENHVRV